MKLRNKRKWSKGQMAREIVLFCLRGIKWSVIVSFILKTACVVFSMLHPETPISVDLNDVLIFAGIAFCGELGLTCAKRILAKPSENNTDESNIY